MLSLGKKSSEICIKFSAEFSNLHFTPPVESLGKEHLLKKLERLLIFGKKFEAVLSKLFSKCPEEHFEELIFFEKFLFSLSFSEIVRKTFGLLSKTAQQGCKNAFHFSRRNFLRENSFFLNSSLSHLVQIVGKKIRPFVGKTLAVLSNLQSTYTIELFKEKYIVLKKICFFITVGVRAEDFELFAKIVRQFCEHCFRRAQRKNMRKNVSLSRSEFGRNIF